MEQNTLDAAWSNVHHSPIAMQPRLELGNVPLDDFETYKHQPALIESTSTWDRTGTRAETTEWAHPLKHLFAWYRSFT